MTYLNDRQRTQLLRGLNPSRIGQTREGMSHLEAYDVKAHLTRIFGFARWSAEVIDMTLLFETLGETTKNGKPWPVVSTAYRATVRLTVHAPDGTVLSTYTECASGDAVNFPINKRGDAHDFAIKTAESQALKRCAVNLGDQFGLSLYRKGSIEPLVRATLLDPVAESTEGKQAEEDSVDADAPPVIPEAVPEHAAPDTVEDAPPETPAEASDTSAGAAPAPPPQETSAPLDLSEQVARVRDHVLAALNTSAKRDAAKMMSRVAIEAAHDKLMGEQTTTPKGEPCTVAVLIDEASKVIAQRDRLHRPEPQEATA